QVKTQTQNTQRGTPRKDITNATTQPHRRLADAALFYVPATGGLHQLVEAGPIRTWPGGSISTVVAVEKLRIDQLEAVVIDLQLARCRQAHVVMDHIGPTYQRLDRRLT